MRFIDPLHDRWHPTGGEAPPPTHGSLLTPAQWQAVRAQWPHGVPVALALPNDADVEALDGDLPRLAAIVLHFPQWTDGRAYSQARLLRARLRYRGEVRAAGEVLVDMLPLLQRTGFDAVQLRADQSLDSAQRALRFFAGHYQGDVQEPRPLYRRHDAAPPSHRSLS
ncbi:MAG: DUF934 domain-containing protein [Gammaproteobacteria bacterium]|uniref:DUF934 domain-containing protein n=1 Tax=Azohydromonas sp. TaxID=1872666 RepID=UPI002C57DC76|nr:DUF934 domain-containing protein [Azohydromonas sp.]HMM86629.1 DUF934 domain-containing protein [Azohydromonas sp.]